MGGQQAGAPPEETSPVLSSDDESLSVCDLGEQEPAWPGGGGHSPGVCAASLWGSSWFAAEFSYCHLSKGVTAVPVCGATGGGGENPRAVIGTVSGTAVPIGDCTVRPGGSTESPVWAAAHRTVGLSVEPVREAGRWCGASTGWPETSLQHLLGAGLLGCGVPPSESHPWHWSAPLSAALTDPWLQVSQGQHWGVELACGHRGPWTRPAFSLGLLSHRSRLLVPRLL